MTANLELEAFNAVNAANQSAFEEDDKTKIAEERVVGTLRLYDSEGNIRNIPIPSNDTSDPLTWSSWRRATIVALLCVYGVAGFGVIQSTPLFFGAIITDYKKATRGAFDAASISELASYPSLCMGIGNFLFVPLSMMVGRRGVFLFNNVLMLAGILWAGNSAGFNNHLAARCLQGLSCGISDCLLPLIILDITFVHRRGFWLSFYWAVTAAGSSALLVAVPFVVDGTTTDWRTNYWFWTAFSGLSLLVSTFFLPETLFQRPAALIDGQLATTDAYGNIRFVGAENSTELDIQESSHSPIEKSYLRGLLPLHFQKNGVKLFFSAYAEMGLSLAFPSIVWALIMNSILFAGLVALSLTYATQLELAPWHFSPAQVGTVQIGAVIGSFVAMAFSGTTVDKIAAMITRRNGGIREAEHLIPNFFVPAALAFAGMILYGKIAANPADYPGSGWIGIHIAFALYYCGFVSLSAITGVWIGESTPHWSGPGLVLVCGGRNAISFAISNYFPAWIVSQGFANAHIELGGSIFAVMVAGGLPLYLWNKPVRRTIGGLLKFGTQ